MGLIFPVMTTIEHRDILKMCFDRDRRNIAAAHHAARHLDVRTGAICTRNSLVFVLI